MVAYSFQRQFIAPIQNGTKGQTIRAPGKRRHAAVGQMLQLYFGMRTRQCQKIIDDVACLRVDKVELDLVTKGIIIGDGRVTLDMPGDLDRFAVLDGFENWGALTAFWRQFHPGVDAFDGVMPGWLPGFWS